MNFKDWNTYKRCNGCGQMTLLDHFAPIAEPCPSCKDFDWRSPVTARWINDRNWLNPLTWKKGHWEFKDKNEAETHSQITGLALKKRLLHNRAPAAIHRISCQNITPKSKSMPFFRKKLFLPVFLALAIGGFFVMKPFSISEPKSEIQEIAKKTSPQLEIVNSSAIPEVPVNKSHQDLPDHPSSHTASLPEESASTPILPTTNTSHDETPPSISTETIQTAAIEEKIAQEKQPHITVLLTEVSKPKAEPIQNPTVLSKTPDKAIKFNEIPAGTIRFGGTAPGAVRFGESAAEKH